MRDKLIEIILAAQGFKEVGTIAEGYEAVFAAEVASRKAAAGKIADALLEAGVVIIPTAEKQYQGENNWYKIGDKEYRGSGGGGGHKDAVPGRVYIPCAFVAPPKEG